MMPAGEKTLKAGVIHVSLAGLVTIGFCSLPVTLIV
jgi:hypothetical protein